MTSKIATSSLALILLVVSLSSAFAQRVSPSQAPATPGAAPIFPTFQAGRDGGPASALGAVDPLAMRDRALFPQKYAPPRSPLPLNPRQPQGRQPSQKIPVDLHSKNRPPVTSNIFPNPTSFATTANGARGGTVADLNHDGIPDLVMANYCQGSCNSGTNTGAAVVMLGNGDGNYGTPAFYPALYSAQAVVAGDFNNDGNQDLALLGECYNFVVVQGWGEACQGAFSILLGNGDGTFQAPTTYLAEEYSTAIAVGDFNGDGLLDVAVLNLYGNNFPYGPPSLSIFLNQGSATFQAVGDVSIPYPSSYVIGAADLNGDGWDDILLPSTTLDVFLSNGDGTFQSPVAYSTGLSTPVNNIVVKDLNADGHPDVITSSCSDDSCAHTTITTFLNNGSGALQPAINSYASARSTYLGVGDLNGDGIWDVVVADTNLVSAALGNGDGTFTDKGAYVVSYGATTLLVADANLDHKDDVLIPEYCESIPCVSAGIVELLSDGSGIFQAPLGFEIGNPYYQGMGVITGDLNGDGKSDFAVTTQCINSNCSSSAAQLFFGNGDGTFQVPLTVALPQSTNYASVVAADVNRDRKLDLIGTNYCGNPTCTQTAVLVMLGNGDGTFQSPALYPIGALSSSTVIVRDLNGDGNPDIVVLSPCIDNTCQTAEWGILLGNGDGTFQPIVNYPLANYIPESMAVADLNGDGHPDIIVASVCADSTCATEGPVALSLGNGDGTFQPAVSFFLGKNGQGFPMYAGSIAAVDINADGKLDLVFTVPSEGNVGVMFGNGDGTFQPPVLSAAPNGVQSMIVRDFDGDGKLDLAVNSLYSAGISLLFGNGDGTLQSGPGYPAPNSINLPQALAAADFNSDGKPDLLASGQQALGLYLNLASPFLYAVTNTLTSSPNPVNLNQSVTFTATLSPAFNAGTLTGNVTFYDGPNPIGTAAVTSGQAAFSTSALSLGTHTITASYSGDSNYLPSTSPVLTETVNTTVTTTTLTPSLNPSAYNQSVTFTANVSSVSGNPTGTVTFTDGAAFLGTASLTGGSASISISTLATGSHSITASYSGDSNFSSSSATLSQTVNQASSAITLGSSGSPTLWGQNVTFSSAITPQYGGAVTGTVTFNDGVNSLATVNVVANAASFSTSFLGAGTHTITATYSGDSNVLTSTSSAISQVVNQSTTTTTIASSANPSYLGQSVTYTLIVTGQQGGARTGTVTLKQGAATVATLTLTNGQAIYSTTYNTIGTRFMTAVYSGDSNNLTSTSALLKQTVNSLPATTITKVVTSGSPSMINQPVIFTATITSTYGAIPDGETVTFLDGASAIGTGLTTSGVATFQTSSLSAKTHTIKASYSGDATFKASSGTVKQVVNLYASTTTLASNPNLSTYGQAVVLTATVTSSAPGGPTGTVTFKNGATSLGSATLNAGTATLSTKTLPAGSLTITATYNGDAQSAKSSGTTPQTVNQATTTASVTSSVNPSVLNQTVKFTATVTSSTTTPTGTVTFMDGSTVLKTATLGGGKATYSTSTLSLGAHSITVVYAGNANVTGSTSPVLTQTVN